MAKTKKKRGFLSFLIDFFFVIVFLVGVGILLYPTFSDFYNNYRNSQLITSYSETVAQIPEEDYSVILEDARKYNELHRVNEILDAFDEEAEEYILTHPYDQLLNPMNNNIMGFIEIPKISVRLAIYHGVGPDSLENGCGHIEGTSLPVGGVGNHTVLSAHRGLPSAKLFTDLDQLEEGDIFILNILGEKLAYAVDQIKTVKPEEIEDLAIDEEKDLATLVTCTPYGVNTHRMLVRGIRTEYTEEIAEQEEKNTTPSIRNPLEGIEEKQKMLVIGGMAFVAIMLILSIILRISDRRKAKRRAMLAREQEERDEQERS